MEKKFLNIDELSQHLGVKKSNLYAKVARRSEREEYFGGEFRVRVSGGTT